MAVIKSGNSTDTASVDPISKSIRVTNYSSTGIEGFQSLPITVATTDVSAVNDDLIASLDVAEYKFISLQLTGTWEATVTFQGSNDGGTFYPIVTSNPSGGQAVGESSTTVNRLVKVPTIYKFMRIRITSYTSGIVEGVAYGHRDENSSGLIAAIGPVTLNAETTKKIGNVGIESQGTPSYHKIISVSGATLSANLVSSNPSKMTILHLVNGVATLRYFKLYNKASSPVVGTDVPFITVALSPNSASSFTLPAFVGIDFSIGLSYGITLGVADNNTTPDTVEGAVTGMIAFI
tara:strand:+ start:1075 stop:1950 length:876 start_codon:yes stop_codon:yes gene_type:complete